MIALNRLPRCCALSAAAAVLLAGCATTPDSRLPAVYCVNAPGAGAPPASVPGAYCTNIDTAANTPAAPTSATASTPAPASVAPEAGTTGTAAAAASGAVGSSASSSAAASNTARQPSASGADSYRAPHGALTLAPSVDLDRYMGRWYVIGFIPYAFENGEVGAYYEFKKTGDDKIDFRYYGRRHDFDHEYRARKGEAYVVKNTHGAQWRVTYTWPIYTTFPILYVDPDYSVSLIGYPGRTLGWVLSRKPQMDNAEYQALLARFAAQGYDVSEFRRVAQTPEQLNAVN